METLAKRAYFVLLAALFAGSVSGCGGGGAHVGTPDILTPAAGDRAPAAITEAAKGNVAIAIGITPKKKKSNPLYVSPSTQSLKILIDGANPVIVDLTPSSPNCKPNASAPGSYICTATINVPSGNHVFTLDTYDETGAKGNLLSTNTTGTVYVKPVGTTTISVTLEGVVQYAVLTLANPTPTGAAKIGLTVLLEDADKNLIVGPAPFDNPVTLTTTDAADGPLSKTTLNSPADEAGLSVNFNGATTVTSITYSATATGLPAANVTPAILKPQSEVHLAATGTGALTTLLVGGTVYAFVPTSSMSYPTTGSIIEVPTINGSGVITSPAIHRSTALVPIKHISAKLLARLNGRTPLTRVHPDFVNSPVTGVTSGLTACSSDQKHLKVYCIGSAATTITVIDGSVVPATVVKTIPTDATTYADFSGGECIICGVAYDPTDDAAIISTTNGIEVYSSAGAHISTTRANPSETFGYNPVTNQVFNPEYEGNGGISPSPSLDLIDIKTATRYALTPSPSTLGAPDQGAVDSVTNLGFSTEEETGNGYYLLPFGSAVLSAGTNSFTLPNTVGFPFSSTILYTCPDLTGIAIDSRIHTAFIDGEFCGQGIIGAAALPTGVTAAPTISAFAFATAPSTPDGATFESGFDPHSQAAVFTTTNDYGITANGTFTYLAVTDLKKLLAAPRSTTDPTLVDPTYDLISNGVVTYVPI